jgi:hypothetical protein
VRRGLHTCWVLFRVTIPTFVIMELLRRLGAIHAIGEACAPVMRLFRLPGEASVPLLLGYLVNVYSAAAALGSLGLGAGPVLLLGLMVGLSHSLVVETVVLRAARASAPALLLYRLAMSLLVGLAASRLLPGLGP